MKIPSAVSNRGHPGGEQHGQDEDGVPRQGARCHTTGQDQQGHLGGSVEAEPHQEADRV